MFAETRTDTSPPSVTSCPGDVTAASSDGSPVPVTWTEPTASDGVTTELTISSTRNTGDLFGVGTTPVRYTFIDGQANTANCDFNVIVTGGGACKSFKFYFSSQYRQGSQESTATSVAI